MGVCHMCDEVFPDKKLYPSQNHFFCEHHKDFFENHSWLELTKLKSTNENPDNALLIQSYKDNLKQKGINSIIETTYAEEDQLISSVFSLLVPSTDYNQAKLIISTK